MDFFDNPIFWVVAIWWLISALFGSKARRQRMQKMREAALNKSGEMETNGENEESAEVWPTTEPAATSVEQRLPEMDPAAARQAEPPRKAPFQPASKPVIPGWAASKQAIPLMQNIWRELGIPMEFPQKETERPTPDVTVVSRTPEEEVKTLEDAEVMPAAPEEMGDESSGFGTDVYDRLGQYPLWQKALVYQILLGPPKASLIGLQPGVMRLRVR
ncbi:hypothetical protein ACFLZR_01995 [Candidatus Neomarinimicrobiota bacterium]